MCHRCIVEELMSQAAERQMSEVLLSTGAINRGKILEIESRYNISRSRSLKLGFGPCLDEKNDTHDCPSENQSDVSPRFEFDVAELFSKIATVKDMKTTNSSRVKAQRGTLVHKNGTNFNSEITYSNPSSQIHYVYDIAEVFRNLPTVTDMKLSTNVSKA